jgi:hypothetical protein
MARMAQVSIVNWIDTSNPKPLCSYSKMLDLEEEARQLMDNLSSSDPSVGDAMFIEYDQEKAKEYGIGRFGRLTLKGGEREYHAAPLHINRDLHVKFAERDFLDYVKAWEDGKSLHPPVDKLVAEPELPRVSHAYHTNIISYESALFDYLRTKGEITLVNPAMSTMVALKTKGGGFVTLTSTSDEKWIHEIKDFISKSQGILKLLNQKTIRGAAYLGTNSPLWYPETEWYRMVINPFIDQTHSFESVFVDYQPTHVRISIVKRPGYEVHSILDRDARCYRYNPESVDAFLGIKMKKLWLESSHVVPMHHVESTKVGHSPWFVNYSGGTWTHIDDNDWLIEGSEVLDIRASGTYSSRRTILPPKGFSWRPYSRTGTHIVTYHSYEPFEVLGLKSYTVGKSLVTCFDSVEVTKDVIRRYSENGSYYNTQGRGTLLPGPDDIYVSNQPDAWDKTYVLVDSEGEYYLSSSYATTGLLLKLGGNKYRIPFVPGELTKVEVLDRQGIFRAVLPSKMMPGQYLLFPTQDSVNHHLHLLSLFSTKVRTIENLIDGRKDPEYGGLSSEDSELNKIEEKLITCHVKTLGDPGMSVFRFGDVTSRSCSNLSAYLHRIPRVWVWVPGSPATVQYVHEHSIDLEFPGHRMEGLYDGLSWKEVLSVISGSSFFKRVSFSFSKFINLREFRRFLADNSCATAISETQTTFVLTIRKTPF